MRRVVATFALMLAALPRPARAQERYVRAYVDSAHTLHIVTSRGRRITPPRAEEQTGFEAPQISADDTSVGWLRDYPNCCTTYSIPQEVVVLAKGQRYLFGGDGMATWDWAFTPDGKRIVIEEGQVHGDHRRYVLRDIRTGRTLNSFEADSATVDLPAWTRVLHRSRSE